jgi:hypothetical protein
MAKKRLFLASKNYITRTINEKELKFFPNSAICVLDLQSIIRPVAGALSILFQDRRHDRAQETNKFNDFRDKGEGDNLLGTSGENVKIQAIDPALVKLRTEQTERAINELCDLVATPENRTIVGKLLVDSLREEYEERPASKADADDLMVSVDTMTLVEMLRGLAEANKDLFAPFRKLVPKAIKDAVAKAGLGPESPIPHLTPTETSPLSQETTG